MRMGVHAMLGHGGGDWTRLREPPLLWINSGVLALSSVAWRAARNAVRAGDIARVRTFLIVAGLLGIAFLLGQIAVWRELETSGYWLAARSSLCTAFPDPLAQPIDHFVTGNPAVAFFYLITGLHGLHILGGLAVWGRTSARVLAGADVAAIRRPVELNARYWHFLLFVWLVMFGLMLLT
jgi:cytochrome c oxidase subunit 3